MGRATDQLVDVDVRLTPELAARLEQLARQAGTSRARVAGAILTEHAATIDSPRAHYLEAFTAWLRQPHPLTRAARADALNQLLAPASRPSLGRTIRVAPPAVVPVDLIERRRSPAARAAIERSAATATPEEDEPHRSNARTPKRSG